MASGGGDDGLLALALLGAGARGFQHDLSSKLQALMMSLDEIAERGDDLGDAEIHRAAERAMASIKDTHAVLMAYRQLARGAAPAEARLADLVDAGAARAGVAVAADSTVPAATVVATATATTLAIAMACELAAGTGAVTVRGAAVAGGGVELTVVGGGGRVPGVARADALALIRFAMVRDGGDAHDGSDGVVLRFTPATPAR
jgi:hypothetical protein|nr:hypothetical protein [Kofleriaceae bacterium]